MKPMPAAGRGELQLVGGQRRAVSLHALGLVAAVECLREGVIVTVPDNPVRHDRAHFREPIGIANRGGLSW